MVAWSLDFIIGLHTKPMDDDFVHLVKFPFYKFFSHLDDKMICTTNNF